MPEKKRSNRKPEPRRILVEREVDGQWRTWEILLYLKRNGEIEFYAQIHDLISGEPCMERLPPKLLVWAKEAYAEAVAAEELEQFWTADHGKSDNSRRADR